MFRHKSIIGSCVKIDYLDQNESFASLMPRHGIIVRQLRAEYGVDDWFLVKLKVPFDYQIKNSDGFSYSLLHCENILIRSRWKGYRIGDKKPTSIFILLIRDEKQIENEPINIEQFYHVAWGMCHTEQVSEVLDM